VARVLIPFQHQQLRERVFLAKVLAVVLALPSTVLTHQKAAVAARGLLAEPGHMAFKLVTAA
jgi:hypothetical protein